MNQMLRMPLNATRESHLEAALGAFYMPKVAHSELVIVEYRDPMSHLARRFFHHLLRSVFSFVTLQHTCHMSHIPWDSPAFHGTVLHSMGQSRILWDSPAFHGAVPHSMGQSRILWHSPTFHGAVLHSVGQSCILWGSPAFRGAVLHSVAQSRIP